MLRKNNRWIHIVSIALFLFSCKNDRVPVRMPDLVQFVNPLMGTASTFEFSHGNVYPAIGLPWGMNTWTPQTGEMGSGWIYQYHRDSLRGFRQTHQPSPWMNDYGTFSIMALHGKLNIDEKKRSSFFTHEDEIARPNYYSVHLKDYDITTEITPSERAAVIRFTVPQSDSLFVLLDALNKGGYVKVLPGEQKVIGFTRYNSGGTPGNFANYFVAMFSHPFAGYGTWSDEEVVFGSEEAEGLRTGATLHFKTGAEEQIVVKIASSFVSIEQAELNLEREIGSKSFEEVEKEGFKVWNEHFNRIKVEGGRSDQTRIFYTMLYRTMLFPRKFYEFDSDGRMIHYSPYDGKIHDGYMYADNGFWDTFRAVFPFFNLVFPELNGTMMQWLVNAYKEGGWLPIWPSPGYRRVMIGAHSASLFADAMVKGVRDFDMELALQAVLKDATIKAEFPAPGRDGVEYYNQLGYVPYPEFRESSAKTLEYAYDDFCIRQMASVLRYDSLVRVFERTAYNYRNVFDPESNLMRGKSVDGIIRREFSPLAWGGPFTEGNAWHYTWSVFHDPKGLIDLMGGNEKFITMMDSVFDQPPSFEIGTYPYEIHEITEMVAGNMGQYAHGNQPIQHMIYLYNYAGESHKAQYWIREVLNRLYNIGPEGYCGDEDNGQTSAWYVFSALGFYPVCPGVPEYVFGGPLFDKVTIQLENGRTFVIESAGADGDREDSGKDLRYIQKCMLNGGSYRKTYISHDDIMKGGNLVFTMGDMPGGAFNTIGEALPYSLSNE